jgi:tripartite-type tricarboxylate transporter receptor subunit TctC
MHKFLVALTVTLACGLGAALPAQAQQTIRLIVPYPAGGTADIMARIVAKPLGPLLGANVIVDNVSGAAGTLGLGQVARAEGDGTTLVLTNTGPSAIAPAMNSKVPYDAVKDFTAISLVAKSPLLLMVHPGFDVKDTRGLIAYAKANPGKVEYSSPGIGSFTHVATERFAQAAGIQLLHIPYKGQAPAVTAVVAGEVKMSLTSPSAAMFDMARTGKLVLLGVSSREASPLAPGVPPISLGLPGYETEFWFGILASAKTTAATVKRLNEALQTVLSDPAIARQLEATGSEVVKGPADAFQLMLASEAARWREVVRGAKLENAE